MSLTDLILLPILAGLLIRGLVWWADSRVQRMCGAGVSAHRFQGGEDSGQERSQ